MVKMREEENEEFYRLVYEYFMQLPAVHQIENFDERLISGQFRRIDFSGTTGEKLTVLTGKEERIITLDCNRAIISTLVLKGKFDYVNLGGSDIGLLDRSKAQISNFCSPGAEIRKEITPPKSFW